MALAAWSATITDEAGNAVPAAEIEVRENGVRFFWRCFRARPCVC